MAEHLDLGLDMEKAMFRRRKLIAAWQEIAGDGLGVPANQRPPGMERLAEEVLRLARVGDAMIRRQRWISRQNGRSS
jgi:hypothetical protein